MPILVFGGGASALSRQQAFRAASDLVVLQVAVHDRHELPVANLTPKDFRVREDGAYQEIRFFLTEDRPVSIGLVVDNSGSMRTRRIEVIAAADAFAESSNPEDEFFLVNFNEHVWLGLPDKVGFTSDRRILHDALSFLDADGQTALYDAVAVGLDHLSQSTLDQHVLIVVSDGDDNRSRLSFAKAMDLALKSNATIYAVGIFDEVEGGDKKVLRRLAETTGGLAFFPSKLSEIRETLQRIAADVRHRYTLGYVSTNTKRDGTLRHVTVDAYDAANHALQVRVRSGYLAPLAESAVQEHDTLPQTTRRMLR